MKAFFGATDQNLLAAVNAAEARAQPLTMAGLTPDEQRRARMVAYLLSQTLRGPC